jgi:nitrite reductase/ring-hydroxylating ferredoxin subunit/DMSO/TMAO reductase YedYZ heme-binding membrane subunit
MSHGHRAVQWTPYKRAYDLAAVGVIALYLIAFIVVGRFAWRGEHAISDEILIMRALATCAFTLLTLILCIGPLCRLDRRFLPLLYNRRHLGVMTCLIASLHALLGIGFYHGFGVVNPLQSLLTSNTQYRSISAFPFEILGAIALLILILMAATSHDFWLKNLSPGLWKGLHMLAYPAWVLLVGHVALGALQGERSILYATLLIAVAVIVPTLHIVAGLKERRLDRSHTVGRWLLVGRFDDVIDKRAKVVCPAGGERIAVFRNGDRISAIANVWAHQGGPLGEGKIIDGCVTCPWHGFQYRPEDGCAPPPFTEKVATYPVRIENGEVFVCTEALTPGKPAEPVTVIKETNVRREARLA